MGKLPYPFFRNRYYNGKLLQAEDFIREQDYFNGKLSLLNAWTFGYGIVEGLRVQKIDGESILLESGCCVDGEGRMTVVDVATIRKLGTISGVDQIEGNFAMLRLYYRQEAAGEEFCALGETKAECAVEKETYNLRLERFAYEEPEDELLSRRVLYCDEDLRVTQRIPGILWGGGITRVTLRVENNTSSELRTAMSYRLETPGFLCRETGGSLFMEQNSLNLPPGRTELTFSLERKPDSFAQSTILVCQQADFTLEKRGERYSAREDFREEFTVETGSVRESVMQRLRQYPLDEAWSGSTMTGVTIAILRFLRLDRRILLDEVLPAEKEMYACNPAMLYRAERCLSFYRELPTQPPAKPELIHTESFHDNGQVLREEVERESRRNFKTGTIRLEAGLNYKPGTVLCSEEIIHGLGPGVIYGDFGLEDVYLDKDRSRNRSEILLGNAEMFQQSNGNEVSPLDKAVKIYPDKGTMQLAVRSFKRIGQPTLYLRWYAYRTPEEAEYIHPVQGGRLKRLDPDVTSLRPKDSISFVPVFEGGSAEPCDFLLNPGEKGFISKNGVYTAPEEDGLYVVTAQIHSRPEERVSAFVIVKREEDAR